MTGREMSASAPGAAALAPRWWNRDGSEARCGLCHHACRIPAGKAGWCGARRFDGEKLTSPYLGRFCSIAVDPIEKKPLYHWRPGTAILSLGSIGCTMRCPFCQNHDIAHPGARGEPVLTPVSIRKLALETRRLGLDSVAYTYNEPALQAEYIIAAAPALRDSGIATVLVSNGMYSEALLAELAPVVDAANIDVKTFNAAAYAKLGGSLDTVKRTVAALLERGVHVECTTLVVPGVSDNPDEFAEELNWLVSLSPDIPLHISRYRPAYRYTAAPTSIELLERFARMAKAKLTHAHIGNVPGMA